MQIRLTLLSALATLCFQCLALELTDEEQCGTVRLDQAPGVVSQIPQYDQAQNQLCYSYAAANLINAAIVKKYGQSVPLVSPLSLALERGEKKNVSSIVNIPIVEFVRDLDDAEICPADRFNGIFRVGEIEGMDALERCYGEAQSSTQSFFRTDTLRACMERTGKFNMAKLPSNLGDLLEERRFLRFSNRLLKQFCPTNLRTLGSLGLGKMTSVRSALFGRFDDGADALRKAIHQSLDVDKMPIAISYCRLINDGVSRRAVDNSGVYDPLQCGNTAHAALVVGRRAKKFDWQIDGRPIRAYTCQFLIRDSSGSDCNSQSNKVSSKAKNPVPADLCERGQVWLDEGLLLRNMAEVTFAPKRS